MKKKIAIILCVILLIILVVFLIVKSSNGKIRKRIEFSCANVIINKNENGKYGLIDLNGNNITPYEYDLIDDFYAETAFVVKDGEYSIIDESGKIIKQNIGETLRDGEFYIVSNNFNNEEISKIGKTNRFAMLEEDAAQPIDTEEIIEEPDQEIEEELQMEEPEILEETEEEKGSKKEIKYGVLDNRGEIILDYEYDEIIIEGDMFIVWKNGKIGVINLSGKTILKIKYDSIAVTTMGNYSTISVVKNNKTKNYLYYLETQKIISKLNKKAYNVSVEESFEDKAIIQLVFENEIKNIYVSNGKTKKIKNYTEPKLEQNYLIVKKDDKNILLNEKAKKITELDNYNAYGKILAIQKGDTVEIYNDYEKVKTLENYILQGMQLDLIIVINNNSNYSEIYDENGELCMGIPETIHQVFSSNVFIQEIDKGFLITNRKGKAITTDTIYFYNAIFDTNNEFKYITIYTDAKKSKSKVIDEDGKEILSGDYSQIGVLVENNKFLKVKKDNKWGLYDIEKKQLVLNTEYNKIEFDRKANYIIADTNWYNYDLVKIKK